MWPPIRLALAPEGTLATLAFVLAGVALGTCSGLVPGLHANNVALLLAAVAPALPGPPRLVGAAIVAAGVTHTFLDVVPTLALGVPDPAMAASALPGHRLVLEGRGREALRLSAFGSASAVLLAVPLAVPVTEVMVASWPTVRANLPLVLAAVVGFLLVTEGGVRGALGGVVAVALSGALGQVALPLSPDAPLPGSVLAPLFAGLFGAPVLLDAMRGTGVPRQGGTSIELERRTLAGLGATGSLAGAIVGYLPGVSSAIAATAALSATPGRYGARGFLVTTSGVNTSNSVFALFALVALGSPRTGVLVAFEATGAPLDLPLLLGSVALASVAGFLLVLSVGDRYLDRVGRVDPRWLSLAVLGLLAVLSGAFAGGVGLVLFVVATLVGLVPIRLGVRRAHLMGVLLVPLALG
ncbi:tripartite tricarboxylate transporter permease [Salinirubellus salinus]|uniref:Tripartite tricarboxylate transporter permease n=1 Tax=Salinirubellus salinus TaxID=1364945 RepID=A0A9E7R4Y7_9EURY|nr:tripartite tricarboxylate transporter permease [Salinirubellus salinus]UWM55657.1 tripartite tricarboxylate transporter permease [Salinirubellus salinus]